MKVEIRNLGVIEKAEIDLKPFTVFIGCNGEGKTWAAYTLSAIFGQQGYGHYLKAYLDGNTQQRYPTLDSALQQLLEEGNAQIDAIQFAKEYAETYINDVARLAPNWMRSFMATDRANFNDLQVHLNLAETKAEFLERIKAASVQRDISLGLLNAVKETGDGILYFYSEGDFLTKLPRKEIQKFVVQEIFQILRKAFYADIYTFPTERTAFIFQYRQQKVRIEELLTDTDQSELEQRGTPLVEPVKRFFDMILRSYQKKDQDRGAAQRLGDDLVDEPVVEQVLGGELEGLGGGGGVLGAAPEDRRAALGADHRVDRVLEHQDAVGGSQRDGAA